MDLVSYAYFCSEFVAVRGVSLEETRPDRDGKTDSMPAPISVGAGFFMPDLPAGATLRRPV